MANEITVGTMAVAKIGRNEIPVEVIAVEDGIYTVKNKAGKEFKTKRIEALPTEVSCEAGKEFKTKRIEALPTEVSCEVMNNTPSNERLSGTQDEPVSSNPSQNKLATSVANYSGKMSLLNAAVEVLRQNGKPLNTREIVAKAVADRLWNPTGAKTPNQTLYGSIFREIATQKSPRIVKSAEKGKFQLG